MNPGLPIVAQPLVPGAALHPGTASHQWPETPVPADAAADNGGRKTIPPCSPAFTPAGFPAHLQPAHGRTAGNTRDTGGKPMEVCRKVPVDCPNGARSPITTGLSAAFGRRRPFAAESWRRLSAVHHTNAADHKKT